MRNYLTNLHIVEAMLAFREGEVLRVALQYHVDNVDKVVVLLDNYDKETEDIVLNFQKKYPSKIIVHYSNIPIEYDKERPHKMYHRFKKFEGKIRQQLLNHVKDEHNKQPIDLLYYFDADEIPTNHFPLAVEELYESGKKALLTNYIHIFNGFYMISNDNIRGHCRVFKYTPELQGDPFKGLAMLPPIVRGNIMQKSFLDIHMSDYSLKYIKKRNLYQKRCKQGHRYDELKLWKLDKDARELTSSEYKNIINNQESIGTIAEYLKQFNIDRLGNKIPEIIKLNIGPGVHPLAEPDFINLEKGHRWKMQDGLRYDNNSIDAITISHVLMYLNGEELLKFLQETYRVLKIGGILRITEDNATDPNSGIHGGYRGAKVMTGSKMMRQILEQVGFTVYNVKSDETHYIDKSLMQQWHGDYPRVFFIEGVKK